MEIEQLSLKITRYILLHYDRKIKHALGRKFE